MSLFPEFRATKLGGIAVGNESNWIRGLFNLNDTATGVKVDEFSALSITGVYACVRILAETIASLPLPVYRRLENGGKERATDHYLYPLLHDMPNSEMSSFELRETMMGHVLLWGNAYAELVRDGAGRVREIWPLRPDRMRIIRDQLTDQVIYLYAVKSSFDLTLEPNVLRMTPDQVLHIRGLAYDGIRGYSPVTMNKEALGLASATQEYGARFFGNGGRPGGILSVNRPLSDEAKKALRSDWTTAYGGLSNAQRVAVLEEGVSWQAVGLAPEEAQFLGSRTFSLNEIARMFRVPPHLLAELARATNNNIEHQGLDFITHTVRPWALRWEQAFFRSLFQPGERADYFAEFLLDGLARGDMVARYQAYAIGRQWGWLNANEIREKENLNPIDPEDGDGDGYIIPLNFTPEVPDATQVQPVVQDDPGAGDDVIRMARVFFEDAMHRCAKRIGRDAAEIVGKHGGDMVRTRALLAAKMEPERQAVLKALLPLYTSLAGPEEGGKRASTVADAYVGEVFSRLLIAPSGLAISAIAEEWELNAASVVPDLLAAATLPSQPEIRVVANINVPAQAAPIVNLTVPERSIENHIENHLPEQPAPVVNNEFHNEVRLPELSAPIVNVDVHVPEQPAPQVKVQNTVNVPRNKGSIFQLPDGRKIESEPKE